MCVYMCMREFTKNVQKGPENMYQKDNRLR